MSDEEKQPYLIHTVRICYPVNIGGFENYESEEFDSGRILETEAGHLAVVLEKLDLGAIKISSVLIDRRPSWYE